MIFKSASGRPACHLCPHLHLPGSAPGGCCLCWRAPSLHLHLRRCRRLLGVKLWRWRAEGRARCLRILLRQPAWQQSPKGEPLHTNSLFIKVYLSNWALNAKFSRTWFPCSPNDPKSQKSKSPPPTFIFQPNQTLLNTMHYNANATDHSLCYDTIQLSGLTYFSSEPTVWVPPHSAAKWTLWSSSYPVATQDLPLSTLRKDKWEIF